MKGKSSMRVTDRRKTSTSTETPPPMSDAALLSKAQTDEPEKTFQVVVGALKDYLRARTRKGTANGSPATFTIPAPDHAVVDEIGRYVVQALLSSADPRAWTLVAAETMRTGDVFVHYAIANGRPQDEEVTVVSTRMDVAKRQIVFRVRSPRGEYVEVRSTPDYLFFVHRPTTEDLAAELGIVP